MIAGRQDGNGAVPAGVLVNRRETLGTVVYWHSGTSAHRFAALDPRIRLQRIVVGSDTPPFSLIANLQSPTCPPSIPTSVDAIR